MALVGTFEPQFYGDAGTGEARISVEDRRIHKFMSAVNDSFSDSFLED